MQLLLDKQNGIISLFRLNGLRSAAFWLGIVISDLVLFYGLGFIILVMGFGFQQPPFVKVLMTRFANLMCLFLKLFSTKDFNNHDELCNLPSSCYSYWGRIVSRFKGETCEDDVRCYYACRKLLQQSFYYSCLHFLPLSFKAIPSVSF